MELQGDTIQPTTTQYLCTSKHSFSAPLFSKCHRSKELSPFPCLCMDYAESYKMAELQPFYYLPKMAILYDSNIIWKLNKNFHFLMTVLCARPLKYLRNC